MTYLGGRGNLPIMKTTAPAKKTKKTRAPRNQTLTLSAAEEKRLAKTLKKYSPKENPVGSIFNDDFLKAADKLPKNSVDLLLLDPPYNLTKDYGTIKFQLTKNGFTIGLLNFCQRLSPALRFIFVVIGEHRPASTMFYPNIFSCEIVSPGNGKKAEVPKTIGKTAPKTFGMRPSARPNSHSMSTQ
jgi:site-specific DNA-adenine methylase